MSAKFQNLKEELRSLENEERSSRSMARGPKNGLSRLGLAAPKWLKISLLSIFLGVFAFFVGVRYINVSPSEGSNPFFSVQDWVNEPDEELLAGMGSWMEEMGYGDLSRETLIELREQGVTATFTSRMHDLGYTDLSLDQLVRLRQNDVSSTFAAMMKELGYSLSVEELIELRQHEVTVYYTSNLQDLGYNELTKEQLIRLKDVGVSVSDVRNLMEEQGQQPDINELIRYRISNQ